MTSIKFSTPWLYFADIFMWFSGIFANSSILNLSTLLATNIAFSLVIKLSKFNFVASYKFITISATYSGKSPFQTYNNMNNTAMYNMNSNINGYY